MSTPRSDKIVLFIDDDENALSGWSLYLQGAGYSVVSASKVQDGLQFFATKRVDAVVLDFHMPDMNGDEAAALIKRIKPQTAVLMFSGNPLAIGKEHPSIDAFIVKGQPPSVVLNALDGLLGVEQHRAAADPK